MTIYELENISHCYDGDPVLTIDRWTMASDSVTGVLGPNGSGKSTLLALLGFIIPPTHGEIRFNGRGAEPFADAVRGKVVLLPQESFLLKRSVYRNIAYGLKALGGNGKREQRVTEALKMVGLEATVYAGRPWYALSGGEARRVALAARLALQPEVLLMDEPTTSVDAASAQLIKEAALHARAQWGTTLIISSHDTEWLEDICTHTLHLFRGRPMGSGRRTLIFGPWKRHSGSAVKALTEDQHFLAAAAPEDLQAAVAAIEAKHLGLIPQSTAVSDGQHSLRGILLRLSFERSTGRTCASVVIGSTTLTIYLPEKDSVGAYQPGQPVQVVYHPCNVTWY
jgi:tungstate transport system ATP-binding protein